MSKVLMVIIDALASSAVLPAMQKGQLPTFKKLAEAGILIEQCTSIFPSITPAATATLGTGHYPAEHGVTGHYFYDLDEDRVHYFGDDFWVVLEQGMDAFFDDFLRQLNLRCLQTPTIYELVESQGKSAGCLNFMIFRGEHPHDVRVPLPLRWIPGVPDRQHLHGPQLLALGDFVTPEILIDGELESLEGPGGMFDYFGFNDANTAARLKKLGEQDKLPDFLLAYFPDNDFRSHEVGPGQAVDQLEKVDAALAEFFETRGGLEQTLEEMVVVITGDHSQSRTGNAESASVDLSEVLGEYTIVKAGAAWENGEQLMICPNMRAAQIYIRPGLWPLRGRISEQLLSIQKVDQVIWREVVEGQVRYQVSTEERGMLQFWAARKIDDVVVDEFGGRWCYQGDLRTVDGHVSDGQICFPEYPNAFERLAGAFNSSASADFWVTAKLGYEFHLPNTSVHASGGSHASLHAADSTSPLFVAGQPADFTLPEHCRIVDIVPICLKLLGLDSPRQIGQCHVPNQGQELQKARTSKKT